MSLSLEVVAENRETPAEDQIFSAWLADGDVTVAFIRGRFTPEDVFTETGGLRAQKGCWLWDIETRKEYRNMGHSKTIMAMTAEYFSVETMSHAGGFTPDGFEYVSKSVERPYGASLLTGPSFEEQDFVADWVLKTRI